MRPSYSRDKYRECAQKLRHVAQFSEVRRNGCRAEMRNELEISCMMNLMVAFSGNFRESKRGRRQRFSVGARFPWDTEQRSTSFLQAPITHQINPWWIYLLPQTTNFLQNDREFQTQFSHSYSKSTWLFSKRKSRRINIPSLTIGCPTVVHLPYVELRNSTLSLSLCNVTPFLNVAVYFSPGMKLSIHNWRIIDSYFRVM